MSVYDGIWTYFGVCGGICVYGGIWRYIGVTSALGFAVATVAAGCMRVLILRLKGKRDCFICRNSLKLITFMGNPIMAIIFIGITIVRQHCSIVQAIPYYLCNETLPVRITIQRVDSNHIFQRHYRISKELPYFKGITVFQRYNRISKVLPYFKGITVFQRHYRISKELPYFKGINRISKVLPYFKGITVFHKN